MPATSLRVLLTADQIRARIEALGRQIDADYAGCGPLYLICVLKGAIFFYADLARAIEHPVRMEFMGISSYGTGKTSSGEVLVTKDVGVPIEGYDVLLVEDILDSGNTLHYLTQVLRQRKPRSLRIATLLDKPERRVRPVQADYSGFEIPDEFVVGFGLDYAEDYRQLRDICVLESTDTPA